MRKRAGHLVSVLLCVFATTTLWAAEQPQEVVAKFYKTYLRYLEGVDGKTRSPKQAEAQTAGVTRPFFTPRFQAEQARLAKSCAAPHAPNAEVPEECDGDRLICAQERPTWYQVADSDAGAVNVELCFNCGEKTPYEQHDLLFSRVAMKKSGSRWLIDGIACVGTDQRALDGDDFNELAKRAASELATCPGLARGTKVALSDVSNRTDEHIDKSRLVSALGRELGSKAGLALEPGAATAGRGTLEAALTSAKTEKAGKYHASYQLELSLASGGSTCRKSASLEKQSEKDNDGDGDSGD